NINAPPTKVVLSTTDKDATGKTGGEREEAVELRPRQAIQQAHLRPATRPRRGEDARTTGDRGAGPHAHAAGEFRRQSVEARQLRPVQTAEHRDLRPAAPLRPRDDVGAAVAVDVARHVQAARERPFTITRALSAICSEALWFT